MPRARTPNRNFRQTAATEYGSGCLSLSWMPILAILCISSLITLLSLNTAVPTYAQSETGLVDLSPIFTPEIQYWKNNILRWASASSLDPDLVAVVMQIESCGDPFAQSSAGAMGLFQVMPFHFLTGENPYQPDVNALRGLNYLARSLETARGNVRLALAGYNGGIGVIPRNEWSWPAETLRYVYYGAPIYQDAKSGLIASSNLDDWYRKFGASLCRQASRRLGIGN